MSKKHMTTADQSSVDELLANASVLLVSGPGGVGKTTLSAALAARAARDHGRRALVVTVDPARRLADALGISASDEPMLVPVGDGAGRLWSLMINMSSSWDQIVERTAPDEVTRKALLTNPLYRTLTQRFVQSHDYIALDHLVDLAADGRYDLVVVDTPPSVHALDILDAPDKMADFFGSRLLRWLVAPYGSRVVQLAAKPFLSVAERLLGGPFLSEITEFFWLFSKLQDEFADRLEVVRRQLADPSTRYLVVHTPEAIPTERADALIAELSRRGHAASLRLINRALDRDLANLDDRLAEIKDPDLREAVARISAASARQVVDGVGDVPAFYVGNSDVPIDNVNALADLLDS